MSAAIIEYDDAIAGRWYQAAVMVSPYHAQVLCPHMHRHLEVALRCARKLAKATP